MAQRTTLGAGELFGQMAILDDGPRSATCAAEGPVTAAALHAAIFRNLENLPMPLAFRFQMLVARQLVRDAPQRGGISPAGVLRPLGVPEVK